METDRTAQYSQAFAIGRAAACGKCEAQYLCGSLEKDSVQEEFAAAKYLGDRLGVGRSLKQEDGLPLIEFTWDEDAREDVVRGAAVVLTRQERTAQPSPPAFDIEDVWNEEAEEFFLFTIRMMASGGRVRFRVPNVRLFVHTEEGLRMLTFGESLKAACAIEDVECVYISKRDAYRVLLKGNEDEIY